jgi:hypothetical protein
VLFGGRLWLTYDVGIATAAYRGLFHSVSAFNNAGFSLFSDNLIGFADDAFICLTVAGAVILGGIGFPVLDELKRSFTAPSAGRSTPSSPSAPRPCSSASACSPSSPSSGRTRRRSARWTDRGRG